MRIHFERSTLEDIVQHSELIAIVSKQKPHLAVRPKRKLLTCKEPFPVIYHAYYVERILYQKIQLEPATAGSYIEVRMAHFHQKLMNHNRFYSRKMSLSPMYAQYADDEVLENNDHPIIFCRFDARDRVFSIRNGKCVRVCRQGSGDCRDFSK